MSSKNGSGLNVREDIGEYLGLNNKVVAITGGARGFGKAFAEKLAAVGSHAAVLDIDEKLGQATVDEIIRWGGSASFNTADVTDYNAMKHVLREICSEHGPIYVMIHNAGIPSTGIIEEITTDEIEKVVAVNFLGPIYGTKAVVPIMKESGGGVNLYIGSTISKAGMEDRPIYQATKHGVYGFLRACAVDYAQAGIRFIGIGPGRGDTPFVRDFLAKIGDEEEREAKRRELNASAGIFRRMLTPDEVSDVGLLLVSKLSRIVTGEMVDAGGFSPGVSYKDLIGFYKG